MGEPVDVVVVGAGSAGLAVSHELAAAGVDHTVLEKGRTGQTWRDRWDSFCLVTPNWTVRLPGGEYDGPEPQGFMLRDDLVSHLERYAASFSAPVREGVEVTALDAGPAGGLRLRTSAGEMHAAVVVLSTGAYQRPYRPAGAETLPPGLLQVDAEGYSNPHGLPPGAVLVVGSGQTGCQLAEELHEAGRDVFLACGRAPWAPRRLEGRDIVTWVAETPFFDTTLAELPNPQARLVANIQATGHGGGHDLHFRVLQAMGVTLLGHLRGADGQRAYFAKDLAESVAFGDTRYNDLRELIVKTCAGRGVRPPEMPDPPHFRADPPDSLDLKGFGAVICTSGFRPDYRRWVAFPDAFDDLGFPIHRDGASTVVDGLYFVGVHFLRKRKSSLLFGVGEDAAIVAGAIAARRTASIPGT
ncbi:MAG: FAD-binding protein [Chloroflexi bacterium]|nr:MAG: FAD-binding protein [Chloroflexota bacterium]